MLYYNFDDGESSIYRNAKSERSAFNVRLVRIVILSGLLLCGIMIGSYINVFANNDTGTILLSTKADETVSSEIVLTVDVKPGDTLWSIAKAHASNQTDVRYYIEQIKLLNGLNDHHLYVNQSLKLP